VTRNTPKASRLLIRALMIPQSVRQGFKEVCSWLNRRITGEASGELQLTSLPVLALRLIADSLPAFSDCLFTTSVLLRN